MKALNLLVINSIFWIGHCWEYKEDDVACVSITGDITFQIKYEKSDGEQHKPAIYEVTVPKQHGDVAIVVTGGCEDSNLKSHIQLKWDKFEASFEFLKDKEKDHWFADKCQLSYTAGAIPGAYNPQDAQARTTLEQELFLTRQTHFYRCNATDSHPLYRVGADDTVDLKNITANMTTKNLVIKPYKSLTVSDECSKDDSKPTSPPKPVTPKPVPKPTVAPGPSGGRVAWTCTIISILVLCVCAILIYHNKDGTPPYVRVV